MGLEASSGLNLKFEMHIERVLISVSLPEYIIVPMNCSSVSIKLTLACLLTEVTSFPIVMLIHVALIK